MRFDDETIEKLLQLRWWDWKEEVIRSRIAPYRRGICAPLRLEGASQIKSKEAYTMNPTMRGYTIRKESESDRRTVELITREAFWNVYAPGCSEHFYVHMMRTHPDFLPELACVLEKDGNVIGNVMYAKCRLRAEDGDRPGSKA